VLSLLQERTLGMEMPKIL